MIKERTGTRAAAGAAVLLCVASVCTPAAATTIDALAVVDAVRADLSGDGRDDLAVLESRDGLATLYVWLSDDSLAGVSLAAVARDVLSGARPWLETTAAGSLQVWAGDPGVGRNRWTETLTLAVWDGALRVAGFTRDSRDVLTGEADVCDVNLLTGRGIRNGQAFRTATPALPVTAWSDGTVPDGCD